MPYVKSEVRTAIDPHLMDAAGRINSVGDLNYAMTNLAIEYVRRHGPTNYELINSVSGVFSCAGQEFYRRVAVPYEDKKIKENGDVFPAS